MVASDVPMVRSSRKPRQGRENDFRRRKVDCDAHDLGFTIFVFLSDVMWQRKIAA